MHHAKLCKVLQMIAQGSPKRFLRIVRSQSGRQDSNLRPSAPKALVLTFEKYIRHLLSSEGIQVLAGNLRHNFDGFN